MLPKSYRLSRKAIIELRKTANRFQTDYFSVLYSGNPLGHLRLSTQISLKIDKRSTHRNQIRRRIYLILEQSPLVSQALDILVIIKPKINKLSPKSIDFRTVINHLADTLLSKDLTKQMTNN